MYNIDMGWCFAKVNGKLAEVYFTKVKGITMFHGHSYVNETDYNLKKELVWIKKDTKKFNLLYKKSVYKDKNSDRNFKTISF